MARKSKGRKQQKCIYIFTEGYTEEHYFKMLNRKYNKSVAIKVEPIPVGQSGIQLLKYAKSKISNLSKKEKANLEKYYIIFDKDNFTTTQVENTLAAAKRAGIEVGFSNECFEVWLVSHFEEPNPSFVKQTLYQRMDRYCNCNNYAKNYKNDFEFMEKNFEDRVSVAMRNCGHFAKLAQPVIGTSPYTNLGQVIKEIYNQSIY